VLNNTEGNSIYEATTFGITGLPAGQASTEFPGSTFSGSNNQTSWQQPDVTATTVSNALTLVDNLQWVKGSTPLPPAFQIQWLEDQASTARRSLHPHYPGLEYQRYGRCKWHSLYGKHKATPMQAIWSARWTAAAIPCRLFRSMEAAIIHCPLLPGRLQDH